MLSIIKHIEKQVKSKGFKVITYSEDVDAITFGMGDIVTTIDRFNEVRKTCRFESRTVGTINERSTRFRWHGYLTYNAVDTMIDMIEKFAKPKQ